MHGGFLLYSLVVNLAEDITNTRFIDTCNICHCFFVILLVT